MKQPTHARTLKGFRPLRKARSSCRGTLLVEAGISLGILTFVGLMMLKLSLNILQPRQWGLHQALTDAYMTFERAYAERIPFGSLVATNSPWPMYSDNTAMPQGTQVVIGRLPGNRPLFATLRRIRIADSNNYPIDYGSGTVSTNPAAMKVWKVQSLLTYQLGGRNYVKSRTVLRSQ